MSSLPVILVSAKSEAAALNIINALIDKEPPPEDLTEGGSAKGRVWHIENKYYTADVQLLPAPDGDPPPHSAPEGHIIYLAEDECTVEAATARESVGEDAEVRVLAAECAELPPSLAAWAAHACLEPVALRETENEGEPCGIEAARAALHAHAWPGLRRVNARSRSHSGSEEDVERAEQWATALGALGGAARAVRQLPAAERKLAAEQLVAAFCRALGEDLDTLRLACLRRVNARSRSHSGSEQDVERAEQWATALGALGGAARAVRQLPAAERKLAAEQLVAAFCRALGEDLDTL